VNFSSISALLMGGSRLPTQYSTNFVNTKDPSRRASLFAFHHGCNVEFDEHARLGEPADDEESVRGE
jgi:hypothetical protein